MDREIAVPQDKDVVFGMMLNAIFQLRDGTPLDEVNVNPDMEKYRDYTLDEVIYLAEACLKC